MKRLAKWLVYYVAANAGYALIAGQHGIGLGVVGVMLLQFSGIFLWVAL